LATRVATLARVFLEADENAGSLATSGGISRPMKLHAFRVAGL
jgi:hypothetical protein